ncbi:MAG TPA: DUF4142 domain-containing protein, partial [Stellaceae bacterium]|nr:DUF4142 domain-containing protein [Stellaceae bacterium]
MHRVLSATAIGLALLAAPAIAQTTPPRATMPETNMPTTGAPRTDTGQPPQVSAQDRSFAQKAAVGGEAEVDLGKLAERRGENETVRDFGRRMVQDHSKANAALAAIAQKAGIKLPTGLDKAHEATRDWLEKQHGAAFDRIYMRGMVDDHEKTVRLFQDEQNAGENPALKQFAAQTLPTLRDHLKLAQNIEADITRNAPQARQQNGAPAAVSGSSTPG